jgi:reactive chlorine resistance protein C|tara:strand:- start:39886 stop:40719 length:834 start_codon:yes stop_codon:yes gene_type:complete
MKKLHFTALLTLLAISLGLLGSSILLMGHHRQIALATDFFAISNLLPDVVFNQVAGLAFIAAAALSVLAIKHIELRAKLGALIIGLSIIALLPLLGSSMWIESLGGFPAIGSGQGVIKYFALLSIGIFLTKPYLESHKAIWLNAFPVILVLLWIGGMKFTLLEAKGIEGLVSSSPLMAWMYSFWDIQTTSNLIGVYDILALSLVILAIFQQKLLMPAVLMSGAVFAVTQTFFLSFSGALSSETLLTTTGHFLIKDLWFIGNLLIFTTLIRNKSANLA